MESDLVKKRRNNIYLSDNDIEILKKYDIRYENFSSLKEMIFYLEDIINNYCEIDTDLEELLIKISEYNYYFYTNK